MRDTQDDGTRVVQALADAGVAVGSVYDLVNTATPYSAAIPVLAELLADGIEDERVAEGVVRALGVKEARGIAARPLLEAFRRAPSDRWTYKWTIGNSLYVVADRTVVEDIMRLATDKAHGRSREMLVATLGRFKTPATTRVLIELLDDADVARTQRRRSGNRRQLKRGRRFHGQPSVARHRWCGVRRPKLSRSSRMHSGRECVA